MDQIRQIRFLIPPFILFVSLLWGDFVSCSSIVGKLSVQTDKNTIAIAAALGVSTFPLGFLISAISNLVLNLIGIICHLFKSNWRYDFSLSEEAFNNIWLKLKTKSIKEVNLKFYAGVTFDHEILPIGIHQWVARRWNYFNTCINCCTALLLSHLFGGLLKINQSLIWWASTIIILFLLLLNAMIVRHEFIKMIEFQSYREFEDK